MFHQSVEFLLQLAILVLQPSPRRQRHVQSRLVLLVQFQQLLFQRGHLLPKFGSILVVKRNGTQQRYVSRWVARRSVKGPLKKRRIEVKKKHFPENRLNLTISAELIGKHQLGSWRQKKKLEIRFHRDGCTGGNIGRRHTNFRRARGKTKKELGKPNTRKTRLIWRLGYGTTSFNQTKVNPPSPTLSPQRNAAFSKL